LEYGIHVIACSLTKSKNDIHELKQFLATKHVEKMKILAKIETKESLQHFKEILDAADGVILIFDKIEKLLKEMKISEETLIQECKKIGKPIIVTFAGKFDGKEYMLINE
jgi:pyruvate kinase